MDVIEVLFDELFPSTLLDAAGRVWRGTCPECRERLTLKAFGVSVVNFEAFATWEWQEFSDHAQAHLTLAMCQDDTRRHLEEEIGVGSRAELLARALGASFRKH